MSAIAWNLIKLDATQILCSLTKHDVKQDESGNYKVEFNYDLSDKNPIGCDIISSEDTFADNALFFQLRKILETDSKFEIDQGVMRSTLIFIDFKGIFSNYYGKIWSSVEWPLNTPAKEDLLKEEALPYRMQLLFKDGLFLSFDGEHFKNFIPFDKSNSMARSCQITFIDSQVKEILDKRLMLDMDFIGKKLVLSKFYAYRGLYLSSASRIELASNFSLNEETVIVLKDCETTLTKSIFSASKLDKLWMYKTEEKKLKLNLFDGEGLISPDFAEYVSNFLQSNYNYPLSPSHSFQIRMPFTKGVLHEVDFNKFFAEYIPVENSQWLIKDFFGITRDLRKAKIILTKSMFKFAGWIKNYLPDLPDPMKSFFEKFAEYDHALYVTNTEARLFNPGRVRLNYQFLSTLDLSNEDFNSLVNDHRKLIDSLPEKFAANAFSFSNDQDFTDEIYDDAESDDYDDIVFRSSMARTTCLKALAKNPNFIKDPKVKRIFEGMKKSYKCNLGLGRLEVEGEQRFLSCDLLFLLIKILESVENVKLDDAKKKALYKDCLYKDRFFMPNGKLSIKPDKKYVFLRNPHLSRNEQVLLRAFVKRKSLHEKYFSHLKGVVMLSVNSTAAMELGGADFDGDLVKVISDKRIVQAVKKGKVDKNLPPIEIPSTGSEPDILSDKIHLRVIVDTFSNKVGLVSNWAVRLAKKEYSTEIVEEKYKDACAKCTIVVGLEIDAAKTGSHPEENIKEIKDLVEDCGKSIFLESKKVIEKILQGHYSPRVKSEENKLLLYFANDNKAKLKVPIEEDNSILERLPACYLKLLSEKSSESKSKADSELENSRYFDFEISGWRKTLDESLKTELLTLIEAYCGVLSLDRPAQKEENRMRENDFTGHVVDTLKLQYDDYRHQKLPCGIEIEIALQQLKAELSDLLKTNVRVKEVIDGLKNKKWHLTSEENRPKVAAEILGLNLSDDEKLLPFFELLYNFRCNGYMLFYFVLKDLESSLFDKADYILKNNLVKQNRYYDELYRTYLNSIAEKKSKRIWNAQLIKICRRHLQEIFGGDMSEALKHYWAQKSKDSSRNFFWNVFKEDEILSHIFIPKKQEE